MFFFLFYFRLHEKTSILYFKQKSNNRKTGTTSAFPPVTTVSSAVRLQQAGITWGSPWERRQHWHIMPNDNSIIKISRTGTRSVRTKHTGQRFQFGVSLSWLVIEYDNKIYLSELTFHTYSQSPFTFLNMFFYI